ncbi:MAG: phosphoglycerate kinase [Acidobacteria bacterium]|nr:phosphoglycerate kinase [Acidobacteriota bacterium]
MPALSVRDLDLKGRRVFLRVDFNVPLKDGVIEDDTRIRESLPTIQLALDRGATVIAASHLGRPKGTPNSAMSLKPVAERLAVLLKRQVTFAHDCIGDPVRQAIERAERDGNRFVLLENLRFHAEEETNDPEFAAGLAALADVFVNDAFGASHRAHASTEGITKYVKPSAAGLLMEKELKHLGDALTAPVRPFVAVLGGAKVSDKIEVIQNLLGRVDALLIGGAMAYTFFKSHGVPVGTSLVEDDKLDAARQIARQAASDGRRLELPIDHVVTTTIEAGAPHEVQKIGDPAIGDRKGVDIGPATVRGYVAVLAGARTVVWNGPMGVFEVPPFDEGTNAIARAVATVRGTTIIGGGDSIAAVTKAGVADRMSHISTGGGASLEFLAGRTLPGVAALSQ